MSKRRMRPCQQPGCPNLVERGFCDDHKHLESKATREGFKRLDERKTAEQKQFYSSYRWTRTSQKHRKIEPICRRCKARGIIAPGKPVHHNPPLEYLLAHGLNPYDHKYLETLCDDCHLEELRKKKDAPRPVKMPFAPS